MTTVDDASRRVGREPGTRDAGTRARQPLLARPLTSYYLVTGSTLLLVGLGLVMVLSASSVFAYTKSGSSYSVFTRQLMWVGIGLPVFWFCSRMPVRFFRALAYPLLLLSFAGLLLVFVPGLGDGEFGATRWVVIGPLTLQPSELAKLALVLWGSDLYVRKSDLLHEWKHLLVPLAPVALLLAVLIMLQPDLGTTMTMMSVVFVLLFVVGAPLRTFAGLVGLAALATLVMSVTSPYRYARITGFLDPFGDAAGNGFQTVQGLYAMASGGWFGVGLGASRQKWSYLPNAHSDFIFAIIGEELGLLGTVFVLILFGLLAYGGVRVAQRSRDPFVRLASSAVVGWLLFQAVVNMGAVTGLLPITGIPLPLISAGGSSLGVSLFALGMLASFARAEPGAAEALAQRGPTLATRGRRRVQSFYGFGPGPRRRPRGARSATRRR